MASVFNASPDSPGRSSLVSLARFSIERPLYTWIGILLCLGGGFWGFETLGRLEDPAFTIKTAVVVTEYPGASAEEVAREVSNPIESQIQKMSEVKEIRSMNQPDMSLIFVDIKDRHDGAELPEIWTKLRNRVAATPLPQGASRPFVNDGYGNVYGLYYAVTAPGFSDREIYDLARFLRLELLTVPGVADVNIAGMADEVIYIEPDTVLAKNLNVPPSIILTALAEADSVTEGGSIQGETGRILIQRPEGSDSVADIAGLTVGVDGRLLTLSDFAHVYRDRDHNPDLIARHNGIDAFTLAIAGLATENIIAVGHRVDAKLAEIVPQIPVGIEFHPIYQQHHVVERASDDFLLNLVMSVSIVFVVLAVFMGWRAAVVVGSTLLLTVVGTLLFMGLFSIEMERISLGALIIAMGMLVDNAIVVADGMQVAMLRGHRAQAAADEATSRTQMPLLGATVIAIMAFAGIGLSPDATGEFLFSLFAVIAIALVLSWVLALTVTPLLGNYMFVTGTAGARAVHGGVLFRLYGGILRVCLKAWWLVLALLVAITVACFMLFGQIKQQFFPDSNTPLFFIDYKLAQGASIHQTSRDLAVLEDWLAAQPDVVSTTAFVGQGAARFMLTYQSEDPNPSYGHMIVRTETLDAIETLIIDLKAFARSATPDAEVRAHRLAFGTGGGDPIGVRFSGPDPEVLRNLAETAAALLTSASQNIVAPRIDWREMEQVLRPVYATDRAQEAGISRDDVARTLLFATDGLRAAVYREGERQIPIIVRASRSEDIALTDQVVHSAATNEFIPFEQVTEGLRFESQNTLMRSRDRVFTIAVGADVAEGEVVADVQSEVQDAIESMVVPPGYKKTWGGEYESSREAMAALGGQLPVCVLVMVLISVLLFNAVRQPLIIWLLVPMSVNGVTLGLLGTGLPFTFTAMLGLLSLSGMLIKNGIVLVSEIDNTRQENADWGLADVIVTASTSRLKPVALAAATTILGMTPLLGDAFFQSMAVTIMGGLAFASVLTLLAAPVLYFAMFPNRRGRSGAHAIA